MKDLSSIDFKDNIRFLIRRELKTLGIKVPKIKGSNKVQSVNICNESVHVFGSSLDQVPSINVGEEFYYCVPKFLVDATKYLENHLGTEGLFRKSGSIQRQKTLKQRIEDGETISEVQAHDVASLIKQFFRQLPDSLLTTHLSECFLKTQRLDCENSCAQAILYLCLLLPLPHLHTLQFFMRFAAKVALHAEDSKMGTSNLAIVLSPNLMYNAKKEHCNSSEKLLKDKTSVVDTLLKNSAQIGLVPDDVFEKAKMIAREDIDALTSSGDELEDNQIRRSANTRILRPRTKSITGFVSGLGQRWKNSSNKTPGMVRASHRRSRSVKADLLRNKERSQSAYEQEVKDDVNKGDEELENFVALCKERRSMRQHGKRRPPSDNRINMATLSPASKRRAILRELELNRISHPTHIVSASTQMFTTPTRRLAATRPLAEVVKKEHAKLLLSGETEDVKVVDTMNYISSPDKVHDDMILPAALSPYDNVFDSPVTTSPVGGPVRPPRRKITRRHSSGATRCFSSSPRSQPSTRQEVSVNNGGVKRNSTRDFLLHNTPKATDVNTMDCSHISVAAELVHLSKSSSRVVYTGSAERKPRARRMVNNMTPCKYHKETPPASQPKLVTIELNNGMGDTEL